MPSYPCIKRPLESIPSCQILPTVRRAACRSPTLQSRRTALASFDSALSTALVVRADGPESASTDWCWKRLAWIRVNSASKSPGTSTKLLGYRNRVPAAQNTTQIHLDQHFYLSAVASRSDFLFYFLAQFVLYATSCFAHHNSTCVFLPHQLAFHRFFLKIT